MRWPDRYLRACAPLVARAARETPNELYDEMLAVLLDACSRRGLRSIIAECARVSAGGQVESLTAGYVRRVDPPRD